MPTDPNITATGPIDDGTADHVDSIRELIDLRAVHLGRTVVAKRADPAQALIVAGLESHAHQMARAILTLHETGHEAAMPPLARVAFECGVTALWVAHLPDAWAALLNDSAFGSKRLVETLVEVGIEPPEDVTDEALLVLDGLLDTTAVRAGVFEQRCQDLVGGKAVYAAYRGLSLTSHAGSRLAMMYVRRHDGPLGLSMSNEPVGMNPPGMLSVTAAALIYAGLAHDHVTQHHVRRRRLREMAKEANISPFIELSDSAKLRLSKAKPT